MSGEFDVALQGGRCTLLTSDGVNRYLPAHRWSAEPDTADQRVLRSCQGPTLDIGCGPGRLAAALVAQGVLAVGIDTSPLAVELTLGRKALALRRNIFDDLPGTGVWAEALLIDGNIGIGGDPLRLLRRVREVLRPGGVAWVEVERPGAGLWRGTGQILQEDRRSPEFRWAVVGADAIGALASETGFAVRQATEHHGRWLAELTT